MVYFEGGYKFLCSTSANIYIYMSYVVVVQLCLQGPVCQAGSMGTAVQSFERTAVEKIPQKYTKML